MEFKEDNSIQQPVEQPVVQPVEQKKVGKLLGKIKENNVWLNHGQYGYYLKCDNKNYKVSKCFEIAKLDIKTAQKIIDYKNGLVKI